MPRRTQKMDVDLFPFLSVLCSVIGVTMLFILIVMTTRVVAKDARQRTPPPSDLQDGGQDLEQSGLTDADYERLSDRIGKLVEVLNERRQRVGELQKQIRTLEDLVAQHEDQLAAAAATGGKMSGVNLEVPEPVDMVPLENAAVHKKPRFVEVKADGFVVHPEGTRHMVAELREKSSPLRKLLDQMDKVRRREYVIFLLHPNGIEASREVQRLMQVEYPHADVKLRGALSRIDMAVEPFDPNWLLVKLKKD